VLFCYLRIVAVAVVSLLLGTVLYRQAMLVCSPSLYPGRKIYFSGFGKSLTGAKKVAAKKEKKRLLRLVGFQT